MSTFEEEIKHKLEERLSLFRRLVPDVVSPIRVDELEQILTIIETARSRKDDKDVVIIDHFEKI